MDTNRLSATLVIASLFLIGVFGKADEQRHISPLPLSTTDASDPVPVGVLLLDEAVKMALEANPELEMAQEKVLAAAALLTQARAAFFPSLDFQNLALLTDNQLLALSFEGNIGNLSTAFFTNFSIPNPAYVNESQIVAKWQITNFGGRKAQKRAATANLAASGLSLQALRNTLAFQIAESYYRIDQATRLVQVHEESHKIAIENVKIGEARLNVGKVTKAEVLRLKAFVSDTKSKLLTAELQRKVAWKILENIIGVPLCDYELPESMPTIDAPVCSNPPCELIDEALSSRNELTALDMMRAAASFRIDAARASRMPSVDSFITGFGYSNGTGSYEPNYLLGIGVSLNLFDGGRRRGNIHGAEAQWRELDASHRRLVLNIQNEVEIACLKLQAAIEQQKTTQAGVDSSTEAFREFQVMAKVGSLLINRLDEARAELFDTHVRQETAMTQILIARARLNYVIGKSIEQLLGIPGCDP